MSTISTQLHELDDWFHNYVRNFYSSISDIDANIRKKEEHTEYVRRIIREIGEELGLSEDLLNTAEVIGLFHDLGRFEQYTQYQTFDDNKSLNHALLGVELLQQNALLTEFPSEIQDLICTAIEYHNVPQMPDGLEGNPKLMTQLLRDADKVDIYRVVLEDYAKIAQESPQDIVWGLLNIPEASENVLNDFLTDHVILSANLRTITDVKIFQLAFIYDINFPQTLAYIQGHHYLDQILDFIPESDQKDQITRKLSQYLSENNSAL